MKKILLCLTSAIISAVSHSQLHPEPKNLFGQPVIPSSCTLKKMVLQLEFTDTITFVYNEKGKVTRIESQKSEPTLIFYNEKDLISEIRNLDIYSKISISYTPEGIVEKTRVSGPHPKEESTVFFSYTGDKKTVRTKRINASGQTTSMYTYEFDLQYNITRAFPQEEINGKPVMGPVTSIAYSFVNNFVLSLGDFRFATMLTGGDYLAEGEAERGSKYVAYRYMTTDNAADSAQTSIYTTVKKVNKNNFPLVITTQFNDGEPIATMFFEYDCK